jgi:hypothetical protein
MAFRKIALKSIAGFDPQFHVAGDDVDVCWRLQKQGWTLGFSPAAMVWHHRRNSVRAYWKQQQGYGKAEAMLERKWPEKYNVAGHARWSGRVYTNGLTYMGWKTRRIYHGLWGTAPFQSLYEPAPTGLESLPMMPEWYLVIIALAVLTALGSAWHPLWLAAPLLSACLGVTVAQAVRSAAGARFATAPEPAREQFQKKILTAGLFLLQPLARLLGRVRHGLTLWRDPPGPGWTFPRTWKADLWTRKTHSIEERLETIEKCLREHGCEPCRGSDFDQWDLQVSGGIFGSARLCVASEPHGSGFQLLRIVCRPRCSILGLGFGLIFGTLALIAGAEGTWSVYALLGGVALWVVSRTIQECGNSAGAFLTVVRQIDRVERKDLPWEAKKPIH